MAADPIRAAARHLLGVFVAFHLFAITFCALPSVGNGMNRSAWAAPTVQGEFRAWTARLNGLGFDLTSEQLEDRLWDFASSYEAARERVMAPLHPYFRYTGSWQSWRMFVAPHRFPARLEIELDRGDGAGWQPLYVARSREHAWHARWFDHDRFRAALFRYAWKHFGGTRKQFADWVAAQARAEFPGARRVRVSFVRYRSRSPDEVRQGVVAEEKRELAEVRTLAPPEPR